MTLEQVQRALSDRYRVLREVGRGGMATVYLAEDVANGREVALKVMSGELGASLDGVRFQREIQIASELDHPNILTAYESGQADGILWYAMPFVKGESVRARLDEQRQFPVAEAVAIIAEVCDALAFAHERGIVHRDIKPENILLRDGHAVVADFGIARLVAEGAGHTLTQTGLSLGTAQYMSPEQASAERVDGRTDVYAAGCVLYEMLVGEPPFTGPNAMAVLARSVTQPVPSIRVVRTTVPEHIEFAILHALEKSLVDRFATAAEFKAALLDASGTGTATTRAYTATYRTAQGDGRPVRRAPGSRRPLLIAASVAALVLAAGAGWKVLDNQRRAAAVAAGDAKRVGVLYFEDRSRTGALRFIADGLTESLIEELDRVATLDVMSRNAVRPFRGLAFDSDSVRRTLGVGTIVRGELDDGSRVPQVTVRLVDAVSGAELKSARFDFDTSSALAARGTVTQRVAEFLRKEVGLDVRLKESRLRTSSPQAWSQQQRAERLIKDADSLVRVRMMAPALAALDSADRALTGAVALDDEWAQPWIARAVAAYLRARAQAESPEVVNAVLDTARAHAERAIALDPRSADAHEAAGTVAFAHVELRSLPEGKDKDAQLERADAELREAVRLEPQQATAWEKLSNVAYAQKAVPEGLRAAMSAYAADAYLLNARSIINRLFFGNLDTENFPEARRWCNEGRRRFPRDLRFVQCGFYTMMTKGAQPDPDEAWRMVDTIRAIAAPSVREYEDRFARTLAAGVIGKAGLRDSANRVFLAARADRAVDPQQEIIGREIIMRLMYGDHETAISRMADYLAIHPDHRRGLANQTSWYWRDPKVQTDPRFRRLMAGAP